jgi:hypothetical protein
VPNAYIEDITKLDDWNKVSNATVRDHGGAGLLARYRSSLQEGNRGNGDVIVEIVLEMNVSSVAHTMGYRRNIHLQYNINFILS